MSPALAVRLPFRFHESFLAMRAFCSAIRPATVFNDVGVPLRRVGRQRDVAAGVKLCAFVQVGVIVIGGPSKLKSDPDGKLTSTHSFARDYDGRPVQLTPPTPTPKAGPASTTR